jgi:hypothetical protein
MSYLAKRVLELAFLREQDRNPFSGLIFHDGRGYNTITLRKFAGRIIAGDY